MNEKEQKQKAKQFAEQWKNKGYEKGESQKFWLQLLSEVLGVENPTTFIEFEDQVHIDTSTGFIDGYIPSTKVLIEQKSIDKDLRKGIRQSNGTFLNPFQQAKKYIVELPVDKHPRWVVTCNFKSFLIYDMNNPKGEPEEILLKDLEKEIHRLQFMVNNENQNIKREMEISIQAGELVGRIYDEILPLYKNPDNVDTLRSLNKLCVRLVFCLYAEDAGLFGRHQMFHDYLSRYEVKDLRRALIDLFNILDQKPEDRDPYLPDELLQFPYVNGGLFADENIEIPNLNEKVRNLLLAKASEDFDWSDISPTIFGAVFESTLNPETRRSGGMHYTSIENIHKVIDPLFLNDLKKELEEKVLNIKTADVIKKNVEAFQNKISNLKFLDPACGSGNFLTETYLSLRKMENQALEKLYGGQIKLGEGNFNPIKVSISQFYGIEINDFAVTVAKTALWIAESQMMKETENILHLNLNFLPLKSYTNIVEGNALKTDWDNVVNKSELNYIMGNPPFVGAKMMSKVQKDDATEIFGKIKLANSLDYVCAWYFKAAEYIKNTNIMCAFVSTNSICQGEQASAMWKPLIEKYKIQINYAYKTFIWNSETKEKAKVHCIIVGFSTINNTTNKKIFDGDRYINVSNINSYLIDSPNIFIEKRSKPVCDVPKMSFGNMPVDDGNFIFSIEEYNDFISKYPDTKKLFKKYIGAVEFLNRTNRYCLWLDNVEPTEFRKNKEIMQRIENVKKFRLSSSTKPTRDKAETPTKFFFVSHPNKKYIVVPKTSSGKRKYIPIGFEDENTIASDLVNIVPTSDLYIMGVLASNVHNAWMRTVAGRLKSDYRYTNSIVYNTFPWPSPTEEQRKKIERTAQRILEVREQFKNSSLADLYDDLTMPPELRKAHQANDIAVMEAYGFKAKTSFTESMCVAELMKMYQKMIEEK